ncbi:MAG TPA: hypothetical protein VH479_10340, partial [Acidimicrobiales bacterium]
PIDSHPTPIINTVNGLPWRSRIQGYDAPFSLDKAKSFTLHFNSQPSDIRGAAGNPVFDDSQSYWSPQLPQAGVIVPHNGVRMEVTNMAGTSLTVHITG